MGGWALGGGGGVGGGVLLSPLPWGAARPGAASALARALGGGRSDRDVVRIYSFAGVPLATIRRSPQNRFLAPPPRPRPLLHTPGACA